MGNISKKWTDPNRIVFLENYIKVSSYDENNVSLSYLNTDKILKIIDIREKLNTLRIDSLKQNDLKSLSSDNFKVLVSFGYIDGNLTKRIEKFNTFGNILNPSDFPSNKLHKILIQREQYLVYGSSELDALERLIGYLDKNQCSTNLFQYAHTIGTFVSHEDEKDYELIDFSKYKTSNNNSLVYVFKPFLKVKVVGEN